MAIEKNVGKRKASKNESLPRECINWGRLNHRKTSIKQLACHRLKSDNQHIISNCQ